MCRGVPTKAEAVASRRSVLSSGRDFVSGFVRGLVRGEGGLAPSARGAEKGLVRSASAPERLDTPCGIEAIDHLHECERCFQQRLENHRPARLRHHRYWFHGLQ